MFLSAGDFDAALADHGIESFVCSRQKSMRGCLLENVETFRVGSVRIHEFEILADGSRKKLRVRRHESDSFAQPIASVAFNRCSQDRVFQPERKATSIAFRVPGGEP